MSDPRPLGKLLKITDGFIESVGYLVTAGPSFGIVTALQRDLRAVLLELDAQRARVVELEAILTAIIYASDGCVGHRDCNHSVKPWKDARHALWPDTYDERGVQRTEPTAQTEE